MRWQPFEWCSASPVLDSRHFPETIEGPPFSSCGQGRPCDFSVLRLMWDDVTGDTTHDTFLNYFVGAFLRTMTQRLLSNNFRIAPSGAARSGAEY